jgi:hypothetical protein
MVTFELAGYRRNLEGALASEELPESWPNRERLQKQLDAVLAEQEERERIRRAGS